MPSRRASDQNSSNESGDNNADTYEELQDKNPYLPAETSASQPERTNLTSKTRPLEVPDSQESEPLREPVDLVFQPDFSSFRTTATEILPTPLQIKGGSKGRFVSSCHCL